jgi:hydrocephalus-inducing protein
MAQYAGVFEAIVENGEQCPKTHKLTFDLRGEGALPTLKIEKPREFFDERTYILKFPKTRVDKSLILPVLLKNDGMVPATCRFDLNPNENFRFLKESSYTLAPKTYHSFEVEFMPKSSGPKQWTIGVQT